MQGHIEVGREYPGVDNHTTYSFGLDDQEFVVAFDTDDVGTFLDLVQRLRTTEASRYTVRDTPSFTCIGMSLPRALNALDGEPVALEASAGGLSWQSAPRRRPRRGRRGGGLRAPAPGPPERRRSGARRGDRRDGPHWTSPRGRRTRRPLRGARTRDRRPAALGEGRAGDLRAADRPLRGRPPTPQEILAEEPEELRAAAGLSRAKTATCARWPST